MYSTSRGIGNGKIKEGVTGGEYGKPGWKSLPRRPGKRSGDKIKMARRETGCEGIDCIRLVKDREGWWILANTIKNSHVPEERREFLV